MADHAAARLRYTNVAIILHWTIALLILFNLVTGFFHDFVPKAVFAFHISSGVTILALTIVRIAWRLTHKPPPYLPMRTWEKQLANIVHFLLYCAMLASPLTGWAMISAHADKPPAAAAIETPLPSRTTASSTPQAALPATAESTRRHRPADPVDRTAIEVVPARRTRL